MWRTSAEVPEDDVFEVEVCWPEDWFFKPVVDGLDVLVLPEDIKRSKRLWR